MNITDIFAKFILPVKKLPGGNYVKNDTQSDGRPYRSHLRIRPDGDGIFILNASTISILNSTAAEYAYHYINNDSAEKAANEISKRYRISKLTARRDYLEFIEKIHGLIEQPDLDPISNFGFQSSISSGISMDSPLRMDCAITYDLPDDEMAEFSPKKRVTKELSTPEWKSVIDKSWAAGVPHLIFTGGEATLRPDLSELLQKAEKNGQVTGLLTNGKKFVEKNYLLSLLESGLDHITTILPGTLELDLKSIQNVILEDIYFTVHATINTKNKNKMVENLKLLDENGVKNISLSIYHGENRELLKELSEKAYGMNFHISGGLPVPYSESNPASVEDKDEINLTDDNALYVQPDGDVLSYQGSYENILGNILTDNIQTMFKKSKEN